MNRRTSSIRRGLCILAVGAMMVGAAPAQKARPAQPANTLPASYMDEGRRIDLLIAQDELAIRGGSGAKGALSRDAATLGLAIGEENSRGYTYVTMKSADDAESMASVLRATDPAREVFAVLYSPGATRGADGARQVLTRRISARFAPGADAAKIAARAGARILESVTYSPDTYILEAQAKALTASLDAANALAAMPDVKWATPLIARPRQTRFVPNDPIFSQQWHLRNTGQVAGVLGADINAAEAWDYATGTGINIGIVDDGIESAHPDLAQNMRTDIDIDIIDGDQSPEANISADRHGISVAGLAAARGNNGLGVTGVAYNSGIVGIRLLSGDRNFGDDQEAQAASHRVSAPDSSGQIHVSNNSWGPSDTGTDFEGPGPLMRAALENGARNGRGGLGTVYVWAAGNGRCNSDNVNYDGYASSRYTIAVGASGPDERFGYYSEPGASMLVNAPSSAGSCGAGGSVGITTTDRTGNNGYVSGDYYAGFSGTSASTPIVSGLVALMLHANPGLGWRDVQHILANTADRIDPGDAGWQRNGAGRYFDAAYGFGRVNAGEAVKAAIGWTNVPAESGPIDFASFDSVAIPDNSSTGIVRFATLNAPPNFVVEHVEVTVDITHEYRGDLELALVSPYGTVSRLIETRQPDFNQNISNWTMMSVANWGENPNGEWYIRLADRLPADTGTLKSWRLRAYGYVNLPPIPRDPAPAILGIVATNAQDDRNGDGVVDAADKLAESRR